MVEIGLFLGIQVEKAGKCRQSRADHYQEDRQGIGQAYVAP